MSLMAPVPPIDQGVDTKFPLIPNLMSADRGCGPSCSACLHVDTGQEKGDEKLKVLLSLTALGMASIRQELHHKLPSPSMAASPQPCAGTGSSPQQTQRKTHRPVSCHHPRVQQHLGEPPHCRGSGARAPRCPHPGLSSTGRSSLGQQH